MKIPLFIALLFVTLAVSGSVTGRELFQKPLELFSGALSSIGYSEHGKIETTLRGFRLRVDSGPGMEQELKPSSVGIYLEVAVRPPESIPTLKDVTTTEGSITTREVWIPAPKGEEYGLLILLKFGEDAPPETLRAIRASTADVINKARALR